MNDMTCPTCKGAMKPLFTGSYCPKDCDRPSPPTRVVTTDATLTGHLNTFVWNGRRWGIRRANEVTSPQRSWRTSPQFIAALIADPLATGRAHWLKDRPPGLDETRKNSGGNEMVVFDDLGPA